MNSSRSHTAHAVKAVRLNEAHWPGTYSQLRVTAVESRVPGEATLSLADAAAGHARACGVTGSKQQPANARCALFGEPFTLDALLPSRECRITRHFGSPPTALLPNCRQCATRISRLA